MWRNLLVHRAPRNPDQQTPHNLLLQITEDLRLRESGVSRGIHFRARETFQALLAGGQPRRRRRPDAAELRASEAAGRGVASHAVIHGRSQAADLPGVHRGGVWVSQAPGETSARPVLSAGARGIQASHHVEPVKRLPPVRSRSWNQFRSTRPRGSWRNFCKRYDLPNNLN